MIGPSVAERVTGPPGHPTIHPIDGPDHFSMHVAPRGHHVHRRMNGNLRRLTGRRRVAAHLTLGGLACVLIATLAFVATMPTSPSAPTSSPAALGARALFSRAMHDALAAGWVHVAGSSAVSSQSILISADIGNSEGQQTATVGKASATVLVTGRIAFIRAGSPSAVAVFRLPSGFVGSTPDRWTSVSSPSAGFSAAARDVTLSSVLATELAFTGTLNQGVSTTVLGQRVTPISGELLIPGTERRVKAVLDLSTSARPLPLELNASTREFSETLIFSNWGKAASIVAPTPTKGDGSVTK